MVAIGILLMATTLAVAQQPAAGPTAAQIHRSRVKMWVGASLIAAGVAILQTTSRGVSKGPRIESGLGLAAVGSGLIWWGATEQARAVHPSTGFGLIVGRSRAVVVRRAW